MKKILEISKLLGIAPKSVDEALGDESPHILEIDSITSIEKIENLCNYFAEGSREKAHAHKRWEQLALEKLPTLSNRDEVCSGYEHTPQGSHARSEYWKVWNKFSLEEVYSASNHNETLLAISRSPGGSQAEQVGFEKLVKFCETLEQYRNAHNAKAIGYNAKKIAFEKWSALWLKKIGRLYTIDAVKMALQQAPPSKELEHCGLERMVELATLEELRALYDESEVGTFEEQFFLENLESYSLEKAQKASSIKELDLICCLAPEDCLGAKIALEKWETKSMNEVQRAITLAGLKRAHKRAPEKGEARKLAIQKMAVLLPDD